jgi:hypothetical protein
MYARAIEQHADRLDELRRRQHEQLGVGAIALVLALLATRLAPALALPLFIGGITLGGLGLRTLVLRWETVERLAGERDALAIADVRRYASREAEPGRRRAYAVMIRVQLSLRAAANDRLLEPASAELEALAAELEDPALELDPTAAVACKRLVSDPTGSPLLDPERRGRELRGRVETIRSGFRPARP